MYFPHVGSDAQTTDCVFAYFGVFLTTDQGNTCELCDDREVAFWCNDCQQWMCAQCKRTHLKARGTKDHEVTPLALKVEQIKRDVRQ